MVFLPDWSPTGEWITYYDDAGAGLISPDGLLDAARLPPARPLESDPKLFQEIRSCGERTYPSGVAGILLSARGVATSADGQHHACFLPTLKADQPSLD
jgi:hypothetical protein